MRIIGTNRPGAVTQGGVTRRSDGSGSSFAPVTTDPASRPATPMSMTAMAGLDALMSLQMIDADRPRRRKQAIRRGNDLLDRLEEIRIGLLSGAFSGEALDRIGSLVMSLEPSGDDGLDQVIADIALRAEVELAKQGRYLNRP
jgi:Class II flagellar assembly regulator